MWYSLEGRLRREILKMTVRELIDELEYFDDDMEVAMKPSNSMYVEGVSGAKTKELRAFYGDNRNVLVITSDGQEGAV